MDNKDYYQILGLTPDASPDEIKRMYRQLVKQLHPDVSGDPGSAKQFSEIDEAYDVLGNAQAKWEYDRLIGPAKRDDQNPDAPRGVSPGQLAQSQYTPPAVATGAAKDEPDWRKRGKRRRQMDKVKRMLGLTLFAIAMGVGVLFVPCWVPLVISVGAGALAAQKRRQ